jgi:hypothetical protein
VACNSIDADVEKDIRRHHNNEVAQFLTIWTPQSITQLWEHRIASEEELNQKCGNNAFKTCSQMRSPIAETVDVDQLFVGVYLFPVDSNNTDLFTKYDTSKRIALVTNTAYHCKSISIKVL